MVTRNLLARSRLTPLLPFKPTPGQRFVGAASAATRWLTAGLLALALAACGNPEERAAAYMKKSQALYDKGDFVAAKLEAQNAAQIAPKDAAAHYMLAMIAEHDQQFRPMIQSLLMAVDADPKMVPARVKLGTLYFFGQAFDQAAEQAKAATELAPDDPDVRVLNARLLLREGNTEKGIKELDAALAKNPELVDAIVLRAAAQALTDPPGGLKILDDAIARLGPEKSKAVRQVRIAVLAQENRKADVEQGYQELIRDFPKDEGFQYQLARFYASEGRVDEAEKVMRGVVSLSPDDVNAQLGLAQFLAQMRSPEAAEKALEAFVAENPNQPELRLALGRLYEANNKADAAVPVYEELAKRDPKSKAGLAARVRVAALLIGKGKIEEGRKRVDAVLVDAPDNADALLLRSGMRVRDKKFEEAIADVRTVLRKEPGNTRAMLLMARTHALMNERVLAKDAYRRLLTTNPNDPNVPRELAELEMMDKNYEAAEKLLRTRTTVAPGDMDAGARLVNVLAVQKAWGEAEREALRVAALPQDKGEGQFLLGRLLLAQGKKQEAVDAFRKSQEKSPNSTTALEGLVDALTSMGKRDEAMATLQAFRARNPGDVGARFLEGGVLAREGKNVEATKIFSDIVKEKPEASLAWAALAGLRPNDAAGRIDAYKRGLAASPGNAELGLLLGTEYEQAGRFEEAITHYQELLKVNPNIEVATNNLASLLLDNRTDPASHARALELVKPLANSSNAAVIDTVGWAYYRNKDNAKAISYLERAVAAAPEVSLLRYHLGMAYLANGNANGARQELRKAVTMAKSDYPGLAQAKAELKKLGG